MIKKFLFILSASVLVFSCGSDEDNVSCKPDSCKEANRSVCKVVDNEITCECDENYELKNGACVKKETPKICENGKTKCNGDKLLTCISNAWIETDCKADGKVCKTEGNKSSCVEDKICEEGKTKCDGDKLLTCISNALIETDCKAEGKVCKTDGDKSSCKKDIPEDMVLVEGGTFMMGSEASKKAGKPVHDVEVKSFYIGKYEVTNSQYCEFLNDKKAIKGKHEGVDVTWIVLGDDCQIEEVAGKYVPKKGKENHPVVNVTWYGALYYAQYKGARLPSEAEWEYSARGGNKNKNCDKGCKYAGSDDVEEVSWNSTNSGFDSHPVGDKKKPNELGLYDMSGNVYEWINDWYSDDYYGKSPKSNPQGPTKGTERVLRGGCFYSNPGDCHVAYRNHSKPDEVFGLGGFRIVFDY